MPDKIQEYKYKFSVIIPIYNVEKYLSETIESVIKQDIGFKNNIQIILVNDGSPDNSKDICIKYKKLYPDNIVYVEQENAGVSAARNNGTKYAEGKYINYLDSDDKWELNVFSKVYKMFEKNKDIDVIGVRQKFFEAEDGYHMLDYKFDQDRIIYIHENYECIQLSVTSGFIRTEAMKNRSFDTNLKIGEDAKLLFELILEKERYGVIGSSVHYYRKRYENNSAIQKSKEDLSWYIDTLKYLHMYICNLSKEKYGNIIPYVQYYIAYDLKWRIFTNKISQNVNEIQKKEYLQMLEDLIEQIDDRVVFKQEHMNKEQKIYFECLKYKKDIRKDFVYDHGHVLFNNIFIRKLKTKNYMQIAIVDVKEDTLYLEGKIKDFYPSEDYELFVKDNKNNKYYLDFYNITCSEKYSIMGDCYSKDIGFKAKIPIKGIKQIRIMITYKKEHTRRIGFNFKITSGMNPDIDNSYIEKGKYILTTKDNKINIIKKNKRKRILNYEYEYIKELTKQKKFKIILYRILYHFLRKIKKHPIWLISDRIDMANDNGIHLFKYITENEKNADVYFVISKKTKDYKKVKKIGRVLKYNSIKYKLYFLLCSKIISSQADNWVTNPFDDEEIYLRDLFKFDFIFLQHGITKDDISSWLHKLNKNISLFVTSAKEEYNSIINGNYGYTEKQVKLLGSPRYDCLNDGKQKQIVFMPTWRMRLSGQQDKVKGKCEYNPGFKISKYFEFYNNLINDKRILKCLKEKGYKAKFCIHPKLKEQIIDFSGNEVVEVSIGTNYQKEFKENALLITDYSSVAFDFAYLRKPVIYTQFDIDTFYEGQVYDKGYFEYERDGFGPVCYDYETTVKTIIDYIEKDCVIEEKYLERINNFYAFNDKNNCKRVYEEILKLK